MSYWNLKMKKIIRDLQRHRPNIFQDRKWRNTKMITKFSDRLKINVNSYCHGNYSDISCNSKRIQRFWKEKLKLKCIANYENKASLCVPLLVVCIFLFMPALAEAVPAYSDGSQFRFTAELQKIWLVSRGGGGWPPTLKWSSRVGKMSNEEEEEDDPHPYPPHPKWSSLWRIPDEW